MAKYTLTRVVWIHGVIYNSQHLYTVCKRSTKLVSQHIEEHDVFYTISGFCCKMMLYIIDTKGKET